MQHRARGGRRQGHMLTGSIRHRFLRTFMRGRVTLHYCTRVVRPFKRRDARAHSSLLIFRTKDMDRCPSFSENTYLVVPTSQNFIYGCLHCMDGAPLHTHCSAAECAAAFSVAPVMVLEEGRNGVTRSAVH